jgi:hypothetical protein
VADLLGHSSISVTGDIYGHTTDTAARGAIDGWSGALGLYRLDSPVDCRSTPPGALNPCLGLGHHRVLRGLLLAGKRFGFRHYLLKLVLVSFERVDGHIPQGHE